MGVILAAALIVVALLWRIVSAILTDELKAWTPTLVDRLIQSAVRRLPEEQRERFAEEWPSHVSEVPGNLSKLYAALGFLRASWKMTPEADLDLPYISIKRAIDIFTASIGLLSVSPLLLTVSLLIKLGSEGPSLCWETRFGYGGKPIKIAKFRTRRVGSSEYAPLGKLISRANIDELPQLFNVLRGDLSMVGPHPNKLNWPNQPQHKAKPGLTGWAQLYGATSIEEKNKYDDWYAQQRSIWLDLKIIFWTAVFWGPPKH
jgi:sugar transferase EpsL